MATRDVETDEARSIYVELLAAHDRLTHDFGELFAGHGVTHAQYNVLRILLGGPSGGLRCRVIGDRLLTRVPDVTRLIDRMEAAGLVSRHRDADDGRVVLVRASRRGRALCARLAAPVDALHVAHARDLPASTRTALRRGLAALGATAPTDI